MRRLVRTPDCSDSVLVLTPAGRLLAEALREMEASKRRESETVLLLEDALRRLDQCRQVLRDLEVDQNNDCPWCFGWKGHFSDCKLAKALGAPTALDEHGTDGADC